MISKKGFLAASATVIVALSVFGGAPLVGAQQRPPGVTDDSITIGILGSLAGPAAMWGSGQLVAGTMYFTTS